MEKRDEGKMIYLDLLFASIFANRHNLFVVSVRGEMSSAHKFGIQNSNYEIDHFQTGGR